VGGQGARGGRLGGQGVSLGQILLSQGALHENCLARGETKCEPLFAVLLLDRETIDAFVGAWNQLEIAAQASGGALRIQDLPDGM
jgi:hypothetical protein